MPLLADVKDFIQNNVSAASGYEIKQSYKSDTPSKIIVIFEGTGHRQPETTFDADYPSFQVAIRGEPFEYEETHAVAYAIYRALHGGDLVDLDVSPPQGYVYCYSTQSGITSLGNDHTDRPEFVLNFKVMRTS
jgi:hypothetical protein